MTTITFFYFRHPSTSGNTTFVELFALGETTNKAFHFTVREGDIFNYIDLKEADQLAIHSLTKQIPNQLTVKQITLESNLEIKDGIRKVFLE